MWDKGIQDAIRDIVHNYTEYEDYTDAQTEQLLRKLNDEGCGYVAFANILAEQYRYNPAEFEKIFGFPL